MASLDKRLEALETRAGGGGCNRCEGVWIVKFGSEIRSATRNGEPIPLEEARALSEEDECPECKGQTERYTVRLKGLDEKPRGPAPE